MPPDFPIQMPAALAEAIDRDLSGWRVERDDDLPTTVGFKGLKYYEPAAAAADPLAAIEEARRHKLKFLNLAGCELVDLPKQVTQLPNLTGLGLVGNNLTTLPRELSQRPALKALYLAGNGFKSLPPVIEKLLALRELSLFGNQISKVPAGIKRLTKLEWLDLGANLIDALSCDTICEILSLKGLSFAKNHLSKLPVRLGNLRQLKELYLQQNAIQELPDSLRECHELETLDLSFNQLEALPSWLVELRSLKRLFLHGNPRLQIPDSILGPTNDQIIDEDAVATDAHTILDFYYKREREGLPLNEVKLLLVGRGEAGKTSISRALRGLPFDPSIQETPGIEIQSGMFHCPNRDAVKVHLWDLAGQVITHETHRYFFTERSLYLVVLDGRGGQQLDEAQYWLSHVEKFGTTRRGGISLEHSPVIVVLNKWRKHGPYNAEERRLLREYDNIQAFVHTDCEPDKLTGNALGIDELRDAICKVLLDMPTVWQRWPKSYFKVKERLAAMVENPIPSQQKHFLKWAEYQKVCDECGTTETASQLSMAENLNSLGVALYYGDDVRLRDTRVLNPNWVANGLYGLLRGVNALPYQKQGQLWAGNLPEVLAAGMKDMNQDRGATINHYPVERDGVKVHEFLLELLVDRELGFQAGEVDGKALYLLPGLLPTDEPSKEEYDITAHLAGAQVRIRYTYDILTAGVMSRLIVRTHALSEAYFRWQRGVVLGWGEARALVMEERLRNPRIDVSLIGGTAAERQALAGVIRSNLEEIHKNLPEGLRGTEELDLRTPGEQYEPVENLIQLEKERKPVQVVTKGQPTVELPVTPELEQIQPAAARTDAAARLKVFVSYSHVDYKQWELLRPHLDILKNEGEVEWWFDGKLRAGISWDETIRRELEAADIVIFLITNDFYASGYIQGVEVKEARKQREAGKTEIVPVLLAPCEAFRSDQWMKSLQAAPVVEGQLRDIISFRPHKTGWDAVQKELRKVIKEVAKK